MKRFADQKFDDLVVPTCGVDFVPSKIEVGGRVYSLMFWVSIFSRHNILLLGHCRC